MNKGKNKHGVIYKPKMGGTNNDYPKILGT